MCLGAVADKESGCRFSSVRLPILRINGIGLDSSGRQVLVPVDFVDRIEKALSRMQRQKRWMVTGNGSDWSPALALNGKYSNSV